MATTVVFGRVPHPAYIDHPITKAAGKGQDNLGKRSVKGVVYHRMIGTLRGTDTYFKMPSTSALTDYGVGTAATDGAADDGAIIRWNDPLGYQSGWASGPLSKPYGDGLAFYTKYGINAINRDQVSIEISGRLYTDPITDKTKQAIAAITAYWADQYQIPWDVYPIAPQDGFSFVRFHQEFTIGTGKICPGPIVMDATPEIIEMTRAILKQYQAVPVEEPKPDAPVYQPIVGLPFDLETATGWQKLNGLDVAMIDAEVTSLRNVVPRTFASDKAPASGPTIRKNQKRIAKATFEDKKQVQWFILADGSRARATAFDPQIEIKPRVRKMA